MADPDSLYSILWPTDPSGRTTLWLVIGSAILAVATVYGPLLIRLVRLFLLERRLRDPSSDLDRSGAPDSSHDPLRQVMAASPLADVFAEFDRRWTMAQLGESHDRAPIRLIDVIEDKPLLPYGPRRS